MEKVRYRIAKECPKTTILFYKDEKVDPPLEIDGNRWYRVGRALRIPASKYDVLPTREELKQKLGNKKEATLLLCPCSPKPLTIIYTLGQEELNIRF